jgi:uncharacterized repeat protein (TIGR03803 family)
MRMSRLMVLILPVMAVTSCYRGWTGLPLPAEIHSNISVDAEIRSPRQLGRHASDSVSYRLVYSFPSQANGAEPLSGLVAVDGTLYGTTQVGGGSYPCGSRNGCGTVFALNPSTGGETVVHRFRGGQDGATPFAGLIAVNGMLLGATERGGSGCASGFGCGTVFAVSPSGEETIVYYFGTVAFDGEYPLSPLLNVNATLYGTTDGGGRAAHGTVFALSGSGQERVLHSFLKVKTDGANPYAGLTSLTGILYGTTPFGGISGPDCSSLGCGIVFAVNPSSGQETVIHHFKGGQDGATPYAGLLDVDGVLYGTTTIGGGSGCTAGEGCGTVFSISASHRERIVYRFHGGQDGAFPYASLVELNGTLYGTTNQGGSSKCSRSLGCGTVFALDPSSGQERVVYSFRAGTDGAYPQGPLLAVGSTLYGTTSFGGGSGCRGLGCGTVFAVTP